MISFIELQDEKFLHTRKVFGIIELLGSLGGITKVFMACFGIFLYPISRHSFYIKAAKKLFLASTCQEDLLLKRGEFFHESQDHYFKDLQYFKSKFKHHKAIRIKLFDSVKLFVSNICNIIPVRHFKNKLN